MLDSDEDEEEDNSRKSRKKGKGGKGKAGVTGNEEGEDEGKTALVELALAETGKLAPYMVGSRKAVKTWLKVRYPVQIHKFGGY